MKQKYQKWTTYSVLKNNTLEISKWKMQSFKKKIEYMILDTKNVLMNSEDEIREVEI